MVISNSQLLELYKTANLSGFCAFFCSVDKSIAFIDNYIEVRVICKYYSDGTQYGIIVIVGSIVVSRAVRPG